MSSQDIKSGMPLSEFRQITIPHGNILLTLLICVHRPIECFFEPSVMYFNIFHVNWYNVVLLNLIGSQIFNFKQNSRKFDYLISIFKMAVGYHGSIIMANYFMCILVICCMCVPVVYGKYICHHSKFILGISEYVSKSQKWPRRSPMSKRPDCYELKQCLQQHFKIMGISI